EETLASDAMRGRKVFTADIDRAADFIAKEFAAVGLKYFGDLKSYHQEFEMVESNLTHLESTMDGKNMDPGKVIVITSHPQRKVYESFAFELDTIVRGSNFFRQAISFIQSQKSHVVFVDTSFAANFSRLNSLKQALFKSDRILVFLLTSDIPHRFSIEALHN